LKQILQESITTILQLPLNIKKELLDVRLKQLEEEKKMMDSK